MVVFESLPTAELPQRTPHQLIPASPSRLTAAEPLLICPSFAEAFATSPPTPRYAAVLSAVPPLLVAPLPRVVRGTLLLGAELARCFERQDRSLPPWRHTDALLTRYDAATSLTVRPDGVLAAAAAAPAAPAAAARRQQQRESQQLARVQLRLQQWGVPAAAVDGSPEAPGTPSSPASPSSAAAEGDSPKSVVQVRREAFPMLPGRFAGIQHISSAPHARTCMRNCRPLPSSNQPPRPTPSLSICRAPSPAPSPPATISTSAFVVALSSKGQGSLPSGSATGTASQPLARPALLEGRLVRTLPPPRRQAGWPVAGFGPV